MNETLAREFMDIDGYTLGDAARLVECGGILNIRPQTRVSKFVGRALTARIQYEPHKQIPADQYRNSAAGLYDIIQPGDVVVLESGNLPLTAVGDLAVTMAARRGAVAVVINANVRDIETIEPLGFPVFALDVGLAGIVGRGFITGIREPIEIGGIRVATGDLVCGCRGGVVAIPWEDREKVLRQAMKIMESERVMLEAMESGKSMAEMWAVRKTS